MDLKTQKGQTMVEYMLLLAVTISLVITFMNSDFFKRFFGTGGVLGTMIKEQYEFSYRHAYINGKPSPDISRDNKDGKSHSSYYQSNGETRFFGPKLPYPQ